MSWGNAVNAFVCDTNWGTIIPLEEYNEKVKNRNRYYDCVPAVFCCDDRTYHFHE